MSESRTPQKVSKNHSANGARLYSTLEDRPKVRAETVDGITVYVMASDTPGEEIALTEAVAEAVERARATTALEAELAARRARSGGAS